MNREAMARLLAFVQLGDNRHVDALVLDYWMQVIGDLDYDAAMHAVRRFRRERPDTYLQPGHLLELAGVVDERPSAIPDLTEKLARELALERAGITEAEAATMPREQLAARLAVATPAIDPVDQWATAAEADDD